MDRTALFGLSGCLATISLGPLDEILSAIVGVLTIIYMSYKIYLLSRDRK
jgi:hypothetical protein